MMDFYFIEFYIARMYNIKLEDYFNITKTNSSVWRKKNFPKQRLHEFCFREKSNDVFELFERIYKKDKN